MEIHGAGHCRGIATAFKSFLLQLPVAIFIFTIGTLAASSASAAISHVQSRSTAPTGSASTVSLAYSSAQVTGDLNVVVIGWGTAAATVQSVTDTKGNVYTRVVGPTAISGFGTQSIYYAKNVLAATGGSNTVKVTFSASTAARDLRIASYRGLDITSPVDVFTSSTGNSTTSSSGAMVTTNANDLIVAANYTESTTTAAGSGYTSRLVTGFGSILEDKIVTTAGSNTATATLNVSGRWIMQAAAFKAAGAADITAPTVPSGVTATATSSTQINLSWSPSSDTGSGVAGYRVERCTGAACSTFAQISAPTTTSYSDTGLTASTAYRYQVRAVDVAGNVSNASTAASATTQSPPDTTAPTTPSGLTATATSSTQINLSWNPSSDTGSGVAGYRVERCTGAACSTFAQISAPTATSYSDTGLTASTTYRYQVRAIDVAGNFSATYSNIASATTQTPPDTTLPDVGPTNLIVTVASTSQLNLSWTAAHDNVGITGYRIERCTGSPCNFAQIATTTTTTYSNTSLTAGTTYSYRVLAYDAAGNLSVYSNTAGGTTTSLPITYTYSYDNLGRVTQASGSDGKVINYTYDANGNVTTLSRQ